VQQVVERVLGTEEEARARLERARKQAAAIRNEADERASASLAQARAHALAEGKRCLEEARKAAAELLLAARDQEEAKAAAAAAAAEGRTDSIVADIVTMITGQPFLGS
jgi:vacuolar-type H+-ATPase subunit H